MNPKTYFKSEYLQVKNTCKGRKLDYIHNNPVAAGLCNFAEEYHYSSASFYKKASNTWPFLTHYQV